MQYPREFRTPHTVQRSSAQRPTHWTVTSRVSWYKSDVWISDLFVMMMMMMIAFITFKSSSVPLFEGLWSSNSWEFELSGFSRNRTDDLGIDSPKEATKTDTFCEVVWIFWQPHLPVGQHPSRQTQPFATPRSTTGMPVPKIDTHVMLTDAEVYKNLHGNRIGAMRAGAFGSVVIWQKIAPVRGWTGQPNSLISRITKLSAIDVTAEIIFERLVLVPGWRRCGKICQHTLGAHTLTSHAAAISRFPCLFAQFFPAVAPQFFNQHHLPSNLAQSQYPRPLQSNSRSIADTTRPFTVFGKHCECIAQKCTHLERLPPLASQLLLLSHCVLIQHGGQKKSQLQWSDRGNRTRFEDEYKVWISHLRYSISSTQWIVLSS